MNCRDAREAIVSDLYGELSPAEGVALRSHLIACGPCEEEAGSLRATREKIARVERHEIPSGTISGRASEARRGHHRWRVAVGAAAVVAFAAGAVYLLRPGGGNDLPLVASGAALSSAAAESPAPLYADEQNLESELESLASALSALESSSVEF